MKKILALLGSLIFCLHLQAHTPSFAVVIDTKSYREAKEELKEYMRSVEADGLKPILLEAEWHSPDSLRNRLKALYAAKRNPLEGAVFIGDIPVPMIRDAQHLTSAFKMDQEAFPWHRSSVPSDRFYDDFDLSFRFLKQDSVRKNLFYYRLLPDSKQRLQPEIYTGRIKPFEGDDKYEQLRRYLRKVVRVKRQNRGLNHLFYFGGSGYNSESVTVRMDEKIAFYEQFPLFKRQQNAISYLYHNRNNRVKEQLLCRLQHPDIDLALLHHHGGSRAQYICGLPEVSEPDRQAEGIRYYLRSKLRESKDTTATINRFVDMYGVPRGWFSGAFDAKQLYNDSLFAAGLEIVIPDVLPTQPQVPVIILDACYNGSFQLDTYMAGAYLFNEGNTVTVHANSVNVLQDKWTNEFLGLLGLGVRIGHWSKLNAYLESHIIGDPSFRFAGAGQINFDINEALVTHRHNKRFWQKQRQSAHPEIQALALRQLFESGEKEFSALLLSEFKTNPNGIVRMECLRLLTAYNDDRFIECLTLASNDAYELVRRQAAYLMGKSGNPKLAQAVVSLAIDNSVGKRVIYCADESLGFFAPKQLSEALTNLQKVPTACLRYDDKRLSEKPKRWIEATKAAVNIEESEKQRRLNIRMLRNYNIHEAVPMLCEMLRNESSLQLRIMLVEALGWFNISYRKNEIITACNQLLDEDKLPEPLKIELRRTIRRLSEPWYR